MKFLNSIIIISALFPFSLFGQEVDPKLISEIEQKTLIQRVEELKDSELNVFVSEMQKLELEFEEMFKTKNQECRGAFLSYVINDKGEKEEKSKRLNRKERNLCYYLLINSRIEITKKINEIRLFQLERVHKKQTEDLRMSQDKTITELLKLSKKYQ